MVNVFGLFITIILNYMGVQIEISRVFGHILLK